MIAKVTEGGSFVSPRLSEAVPETVTLLSGESVVSLTAVTVTSPVLVVALAAKVRVVAVLNVKSPATAGDTAAAATVTVTAADDCRSSVAVTVAMPPDSEIELEDSASADRGVSSSVMVKVWSDGFATPLPPAAVPETVTDLLPEAALLPLAVTVTVPALVVAPAAMVNVVPVLRSKSDAAAPVPAAAATVTVTASLDGPDNVALTVETPPSSEIEAGPRTSAAVGRVSSSVRVRVAALAVPAPWPFVSVADTVTVLSGASTALSLAVTVTSPALVVAPAATVSVLAVPRLKSPATAGDTAAADTVTVVGWLDGCDNTALTVDRPPFSETDVGSSSSTASGAASSSVKVRVAELAVPAPRPFVSVADTVTVLFGASVGLSTAVTVTSPALVVTPAATVSVFPVRVKSPCTAGETAAVATVTVVGWPDGCDSTAVTVARPPFSETDEADSASDASGAASSSVMVSAPTPGSAMPLPPAVVPEIRTNLVAVPMSTSLSTAVTVTNPMLTVEPAAMVSVFAVLSVKSPATAGDTADAATVTVVAALDLPDSPDSAAVTVAMPPFSEIELEESTSDTTGRVSSSVIVSDAPVTAPAPRPLVSAPVTVAPRPAFPWWRSSSTTVIVAVSEAAVVAPAAMTMVASVPTV